MGRVFSAKARIFCLARRLAVVMSPPFSAASPQQHCCFGLSGGLPVNLRLSAPLPRRFPGADGWHNSREKRPGLEERIFPLGVSGRSRGGGCPFLRQAKAQPQAAVGGQPVQQGPAQAGDCRQQGRVAQGLPGDGPEQGLAARRFSPAVLVRQ